MTPSPVADSLLSALGSPNEPLLAAALHHADTGSCPVAAPARSVLSPGQPARARENAPLTTRQPWEGRLLR